MIASAWTAVIPLVREHQPDVVILDFDAIDRTGRELLTKLLSTRYQIAIITIGSEDAVEFAARLGIPITVPKPLSAGVLLGHVDRIIGIRPDP